MDVDLYGIDDEHSWIVMISGNASLMISIVDASSFPGGGVRRRDASLKANLQGRFRFS